MKKIKSPTTSKQIKDGVGLGPPPPLYVKHRVAIRDRLLGLLNYEIDQSK